jgi:hypothetical protein
LLPTQHDQTALLMLLLAVHWLLLAGHQAEATLPQVITSTLVITSRPQSRIADLVPR